jgi:cell division protein FtsI/penicillin-binding protein 2
LRHAMEAVTQPGGTADGMAPEGFPVAMKTGNASALGLGYHVNYVGVGPLPRPVITFCVRVTASPTRSTSPGPRARCSRHCCSH